MTNHVGRNDPSPCGCGKKYKKCCRSKDAPLPGPFAGERQSALNALMCFSARAEFEGEHRVDVGGAGAGAAGLRRCRCDLP